MPSCIHVREINIVCIVYKKVYCCYHTRIITTVFKLFCFLSEFSLSNFIAHDHLIKTCWRIFHSRKRDAVKVTYRALITLQIVCGEFLFIFILFTGYLSVLRGSSTRKLQKLVAPFCPRVTRKMCEKWEKKIRKEKFQFE